MITKLSFARTLGMLPLLLSTDAAANETILCPVWSHVPPDYMNPGKYLLSKAKHFERFNAWTSVTLYQTEEEWQQNPRKDQVLSEVEEAINKALDLFGTHAGTPTKPAHIHITVASFIHSSWRDPYVQRDEWPTKQGDASVCYLVVGFPLNDLQFPFVELKKAIASGMYRCIMQYYHPKIDTDEYSTLWWASGLPRFFDGLAWPATEEMVGDSFANIKGRPYPEQFALYKRLYEQSEETALF